jgi:hypothetical protein
MREPYGPIQMEATVRLVPPPTGFNCVFTLGKRRLLPVSASAGGGVG